MAKFAPTGEITLVGSWHEPERRGARIIITAGPGFVGEARGLIGRAIRQTLKVKRWGVEPYSVGYLPQHAGEHGDPASYYLYATDAEMVRLITAIKKLAKAEGWNLAPIDVYHD